MSTFKRYAVITVITLFFQTTTAVYAAPGPKATVQALQAEIAARIAGDAALQGSIDNIILTPGPQGDQGLQGEQGPQGVAGPPGPEGPSAPDRTADLCALYQSLSDQGLIGDLTVPAYCPPPLVNIVFKTSARYTGYALGGLNGADEKCQAAALSAGLSGTYKAWLSDININARDRLNHSTQPYVRTDGVVVAANWDDLVDGTIMAPINFNEFGQDIDFSPPPFMWTFTQNDGTFANGGSCEDSNNPSAEGLVGDPRSIDSTWTSSSLNACSVVINGLYCIGQ